MQSLWTNHTLGEWEQGERERQRERERERERQTDRQTERERRKEEGEERIGGRESNDVIRST